MSCSLELRAQLWSKVFPGMQTIKIQWYDSNCYIVFSNCCFTLRNYKCKTVKDMNDINFRNKNIRNLNIAISRKAMLFSEARESQYTSSISPSSCLQSSGLVQLCRCSCRYLTFGSLNFYLYSFILPLPSFSVSKQTHFPCLVFSHLYFHPLLHKKLGGEQEHGECLGLLTCVQQIRDSPADIIPPWISASSSCVSSSLDPGGGRVDAGWEGSHTGNRSKRAKLDHGTANGYPWHSLSSHVENTKQNVTALQTLTSFPQF